jgi:general secretion pathway protein D
MVMRDTAAILPIVHRSYDVLASVGERIATVTQEMGPTDGAEGGIRQIGDSEITAAPDTIDWKKFFSELGVKWPDGSSIRYLKSIGKIMVANTADNLAVFEQRLAELNVVPSQIEIEARFVEVEQKDLSALGFEWLLTDDWEIAHNKNGSGERIGMTADTTTTSPDGSTTRGGFSKGLRLPSDNLPLAFPGAESGVSLGAVQDKVLTIASVLTNPELSMVLHALQQKGDTDLLSAPKVTTQSGVEATIKVVTEFIYPTEFDVQPIMAPVATEAGGVVAVILSQVGGIVEPGAFETREVGVILQVLPEVSAEGQMISLTLAPEVVTEPIWRDYGMDFPTVVNGKTEKVHLPMAQPFFHSRSVSTSIIIYNGATVVMGGMITEKHDAIDDKIPLLGDLPLIGHLFRSEMDQSSKRNLLIFVTARLVDPAGFGVGKPVIPTAAVPAERPNG